MAVRVGSLFVDLRASTSKLAGDISKAGPVMRRQFNTTVKRALLGGTAAATGLAVAVGQASKRIDLLAKTSDKLGIPTDRLRALQDVGKKTGVEINTLNMGIQRMTRRVSEAAQGTGEAQGALKELGIDAKALNSLSPDQQFGKIADAMSNVSNQGDRVRLSMRLFDSEGVALVNTLSRGGKAIDLAALKLAGLGVSLNRIDAAKVELANDAMDDLKLVTEGVTNQFAVALAPVIKGIADQLMGAAGETGGFRDQIIRLVEIGVKGFAFLANAMKGWQVIIKAGEVGFLGMGEVVLRAMQHISTSIDGVVNFALDKINMLIRAYNSLPEFMRGDAVGEFEIGVSDRTSGLAGLADSFAVARKQAQGELVNVLSEPLPTTAVDSWLTEVRAKTDEAAAEIAETVNTVKQEINETPLISQETVDDTAAKISNIGQRAQTLKTSLLGWVNTGFQAIGAQINGLIDKTVTWGQAIGNIGRSILSAVINTFVQMAGAAVASFLATKLGLDAITTALAAKQAAAFGAAMAPVAASLSVLIPAAIAMSIINPAAAGLGASAFAAAMAVGAVAATVAGGLASVALGVIGAATAPGRAMGGHVNGGDLYQVNERGSEFFRPSTSGEVIPLGRMDRIINTDGGGTTIAVTNNIHPGVNRADIMGALDTLVAKTTEAVAQKVSRGGSYRRRIHA